VKAASRNWCLAVPLLVAAYVAPYLVHRATNTLYLEIYGRRPVVFYNFDDPVHMALYKAHTPLVMFERTALGTVYEIARWCDFEGAHEEARISP
jgi:hypothetical protein